MYTKSAVGDENDKDDKRRKAPPTSRFGRLARLGALAPKAIPFAAEALRRAVQRKPDTEVEDEESKRKMVESVKNASDAMLKTLGEMKGLPLKFGQMASYIDGIAPPGFEDKFQESLKKLQQKAPPLDPEAARQVISAELGALPEALFQSFEREPFAAASIGQVHRAITKEGAAVAVKVQYPGIDKAIEADLKSVSVLESVISPLGRRYHTKETLEELRTVFMAELDYREEAETTALFRRLHEDNPNIVIPQVFHDLSTRRVLTTELMGGQDYATFAQEASQAERDAACVTIWTFMCKSLFQYGLLYADPHPGNYRFLGGGRVAFLDFGCRRLLPPELVLGMKSYIIAAMDGDWPLFQERITKVLGYDPEDKAGYPLYIDYSKMLLEPLTRDGNYQHTKEAAREAVAFLVRGSRKAFIKEDGSLPDLPKPINMPTEFTFVSRLQWGLASVMGGLGGEGNYRRLSEDWIRSPVLPLP